MEAGWEGTIVFAMAAPSRHLPTTDEAQEVSEEKGRGWFYFRWERCLSRLSSGRRYLA